MSNELTVVQQAEVGITIFPEEVLENASRAARALKQVISQKAHPIIINKKQYLEYEDLQLVAQFYGYTVRTHSAMPVEFNGVKGAKANADLIDFRSGMVVGGAEAYCMADEENWGSKPWFQLASMAQTRAGAKAIRNRMAWVVVLAGYSGTPAEEMIQEKVSQRKEKSAHWCTLHNTEFFKKGAMKNYAHKIEGTDNWCNEPTELEQPPETKPVPEQSSPSATDELLSKVAEAKGWKSSKPVRSWLINGPCKIAEDRIDSEPEKVWEEIKDII